MDALSILAILEKGLTLIPTLINAGEEIIPLVQRMSQVAKGGVDGTVSAAELDALETDLDASLSKFNTPMGG